MKERQTMGQRLRELAGMGGLNDEMIATDFLIASKDSIQNYAKALAETVSPEVQSVLKRHLNAAIGTHAAITEYMLERGFYKAYDPAAQFNMDIEAAKKVTDPKGEHE